VLLLGHGLWGDVSSEGLVGGEGQAVLRGGGGRRACARSASWYGLYGLMACCS
jgi:hypothetical protein